MHTHLPSNSTLLSIPLELRNLIYLEVSRSYILNISSRDRKILLADDLIDNACCAMHRRSPPSTAASLALVSHQIANEAHQISFHRTRSPISVYFSSIYTLSDFECHAASYQPARLRDFCLESSRNVRIKAPSSWQALPLPEACFRALEEFEVTEVAANLHDMEVLCLSLKWDGWKKEDELSDGGKWVFRRIE